MPERPRAKMSVLIERYEVAHGGKQNSSVGHCGSAAGQKIRAAKLTTVPKRKTAESTRTPPFLLEHYYVRTKATRPGVIRTANCIGASIRWNPIAHVTISLPRIPLWPPGQHEVSTNDEPRHQPARPETRSNQTFCMCHLDHLPSVAGGLIVGALPPTESRAPPFPKNELDCGRK